MEYRAGGVVGLRPLPDRDARAFPGRGRHRAGRRGDRGRPVAAVQHARGDRRAAGAAAGRTADGAAPASATRASPGDDTSKPAASTTCCSTTWSTSTGTRSRRAAWPAATARWSAPPASAARVEEVNDLLDDIVRRVQSWDSCFTSEHSYMNSGTVRKSTASRYRQWLTHKLATWHDQFGSSGCVGCGRCITWCPVGIDLTEEVAAIRGGNP